MNWEITEPVSNGNGTQLHVLLRPTILCATDANNRSAFVVGTRSWKKPLLLGSDLIEILFKDQSFIKAATFLLFSLLCACLLTQGRAASSAAPRWASTSWAAC